MVLEASLLLWVNPIFVFIVRRLNIRRLLTITPAPVCGVTDVRNSNQTVVILLKIKKQK